ncbi:hypothetical protein TNCV_983281 [Trichonephila clavipes]|nr:hypothetical protein TNCV_983281 [Trichonephila clavipes]
MGGHMDQRSHPDLKTSYGSSKLQQRRSRPNQDSTTFITVSFNSVGQLMAEYRFVPPTIRLLQQCFLHTDLHCVLNILLPDAESGLQRAALNLLFLTGLPGHRIFGIYATIPFSKLIAMLLKINTTAL